MTRRDAGLMARYSSRATEFDRRETELWESVWQRRARTQRGTGARIGASLSARPEGVLGARVHTDGHGAFEEAQRFAIAGLRLDSLAMAAGRGRAPSAWDSSASSRCTGTGATGAGAASWGRR
jgi:hypothetical protein